MTRDLVACPCCGYQTIESNTDYEICPLCWWEDDGQDDKEANIIQGGPNGELSLLRARYNFLKFGISNPDRKDLLSKRENKEKFTRIRKFNLEHDGKTVSEDSTDWRFSIDDEQDPYQVRE
jgi:Cysteine-rich CPCC